MNRLQLRQAIHEDTAISQPRSTTPPAHLPTHSLSARTALFAPIHYEANYSYPLLVWLHSFGNNERQLRDVMPRISLRNYVGVAVRSLGVESLLQGTDPLLQHGIGLGNAGGANWSQCPDGIELASDFVTQAIDLATAKFNIHPRRIFLLGAGAGGTMALRVALRMPERFAGVASLGGAFPDRHLPLASLCAARRQLRVLLTHCRADEDYPTAQLCDDLRLFHAAGIDVTVRQYPQAEYLQRDQLSDVDTWVMNQIQCPATVAEGASSRHGRDSTN